MGKVKYTGVDPDSRKVLTGDYILIKNLDTTKENWCIYNEHLPALIKLEDGFDVMALRKTNLYLGMETSGFKILKLIPRDSAEVSIQLILQGSTL